VIWGRTQRKTYLSPRWYGWSLLGLQDPRYPSPMPGHGVSCKLECFEAPTHVFSLQHDSLHFLPYWWLRNFQVDEGLQLAQCHVCQILSHKPAQTSREGNTDSISQWVNSTCIQVWEEWQVAFFTDNLSLETTTYRKLEETKENQNGSSAFS
jgi:hypothetical protein